MVIYATCRRLADKNTSLDELGKASSYTDDKVHREVILRLYVREVTILSIKLQKNAYLGLRRCVLPFIFLFSTRESTLRRFFKISLSFLHVENIL